jgi:hypothetical protein
MTVHGTGVDAEPWTVLVHKKPRPEWIPYNPKVMRPPPLGKDTRAVKILSWNVNGLRALMKSRGFSVHELAQREDFDILCLQETKMQARCLLSHKAGICLLSSLKCLLHFIHWNYFSTNNFTIAGERC